MRAKTMNNEWIRLIAATGIVGMAAIAPTDGLLTGVSKTNVGDGVQVHILGSDLGKPKQMRVMGGHAYILQFNAKLAGHAQTLHVGHAGVSSVRAGWFRAKPPVVRVLVRLQPDEHPVLTHDDGGYTVSVNVESDVIHKAKKSSTKVVDDLPPVDTSMLAKPRLTQQTTPILVHTASAPLVSLDFVNTDIVQIMKALALQAGVNIVTAPEVQGRKITVSLDHVRVDDALDFVTALAGLRYAKVQDSYVVTTRDSFGSIMNDLANRTNIQNVIRIVPLVSGDGAAIKTALSKWFGATSLQVMIPGEKVTGSAPAGPGSSNDNSAAGAAGNGGGGQAGGDTGGGQAGGANGGQNGGQGTTPPATDRETTSMAVGLTQYIMLIGAQKWVDQAEQMVHRLDADIIEARSSTEIAVRRTLLEQKRENDFYNEQLAKAKSANMSQATYELRNGVAEDLKKAIMAENGFGSVDIVASPKTSKKQIVIVSGQPATVDATINMLKQLDTGSALGDETVMYDIKYADPRSLREDLIANVPGLIVTNPPAAAGTPRLYAPGLLNNQNATNTSNSSGGASSGANAGAQNPTAGAAGVKGDQGQVSGLQQPFQDDETAALPMRLLMRGTKDQIQLAMAHLAKVDTRPRQIALEMRVMELTREDAIKLGINWSIFTGGAVKTISLNNSQGGIGTNTSPANSVGVHIGGRNFGADVTATLDSIANKNNLISRPNLLAMDGRESEIFVGDDVRYIQTIQSSQNGTTVQTADVPVGVRLSVLPRIGGDGSITMDLRPVVSFLKGFTDVPGGGKLPQTSLRISQNTVNVQSGETIAIGGLIQDQDIYNLQKVPFLGDLPIIGHLFRSTTHDRTRTEVVFFLTVREVTEGDRKNAADPDESEKLNKAEYGIPKRPKI